MEFQSIYKQKLVSAEVAANCVKSGDWVDYGWAVTTPIEMDKAIAARYAELYDVKLRGGILTSVPEAFKVPNAHEHFSWNSWHVSKIGRNLIEQGLGYYIPMRYSELPRYYRKPTRSSDVAIMQVTPMDQHGFFNFGPSNSHLAACARSAKIVIVEVNKSMPRCLGGYENNIHINDVDFIVEGENTPIYEMPISPITEIDEKIANLIVKEIRDGSCIQLGIGGMPNAVGKCIAQSDLKNLGVHTEMYADAFMEMTLAGKIDGSRKNFDIGRQTYSFAMGSKELYDFMDNNPICKSAPVDYTNSIKVISSLDNFISINNAVNIDLFGQVNSETAGRRHISGAGGQLDFVMGAYLSEGGKSFICCSSTKLAKDGTLKSRILPTLDDGSVVTATRANVHYLVTEYGIINLKGLSTWERCEAIISIAHPNFRDDLIKHAQDLGIWKRTNKIR